MSLVPLEFRSLEWERAVAQMRSIPFLNLGLYSRADWVANGVVFAPIGFFWAAAFTSGSRINPIVAAIIVSLLAGFGAVLLECTQIFFERRTRSLNDIYAEMIGASVGAFAWTLLARPVSKLLDAFGHTFVPAARALLILYAATYLAFNLFPYDFVLSLGELSARLARNPISWLPSECGQLRCGINLAVELAAAAPFGVLLLLLPWSRRPGHLQVFLIGAGVGLAIELVQLFMVSGSVQAISVVTRGAGFVVGRAVAERIAELGWRGIAPLMRPAVYLLALPYLVALMIGNHWEFNFPLGLNAALDTIRSLPWTPFVLFYEAPEVLAVQKLAYQSVMYAPVGIMFWAYNQDRPDRLARTWIPVAVAVGLSIVMGVGRILLYRRVGPDPTNLLLAGLAAYASLKVCTFFGDLVSDAPVRPRPPDIGHSGPNASMLLQRILATGLILGGLVATAAYPFGGAGVLALLLPTYGILAYLYPKLWLLVVPIAIPALDRANITGLLMFDEIDLILLVSIAAWLWREPYAGLDRAMSRTGRNLGLAFLASATVSAYVGWQLMPLELWNSLASFDGPQNILRQLKGYWLPILLVPCLVSQLKRDSTAIATFSTGVTIALACAALSVAWERHLFTGLFNFSTAFRAGGPFSSMNTGGASLDAFLIMSLPFAAYGLTRPHFLARLASAAVLVLTTYALAVTFTRATYLAVGAAVVVIVVLSLIGGAGMRASGRRWGVITVGVTLLSVLLLIATLPGSFMRERFSSVDSAISQRLSQLEHAIDLGASGSRWLGAGTGTFPWLNITSRNPEDQPGAAFLFRERRGAFVRLVGGQPIYFDQRVRIAPFHAYTLGLGVRSDRETTIRALVCEKHLMNSAGCAGVTIPVDGSGQWRRLELPLETNDIGTPKPGIGLTAPVYLSISPPGPGQTVDVRDISLQDDRSRELLRNGAFTKGGDGWFFTQDDHSAWHLDNLWIFLLVEQGILGLLSFALLTAYVAFRCVNAIGSSTGAQASRVAGATPLLLAGSFVGVHVLALTDAILHAPRVAVMLWFLYGAILGVSEPLRSRTVRTRRTGRRRAVESRPGLEYSSPPDSARTR